MSSAKLRLRKSKKPKKEENPVCPICNNAVEDEGGVLCDGKYCAWQPGNTVSAWEWINQELFEKIAANVKGILYGSV